MTTATLTPETTQPVPAEQRRQLMDAAAVDFVSNGWRLESRSEYQGVFVRGNRTNNVLHLILSIVTLGLWVPVWVAVAVVGGEKRRIVSVDEYGNRTGK